MNAISQGIRTADRDELESELARHLLRLKRRPPPQIRNWKALLKTALRNKARNWIRDQQARERRLVPLDQSSELKTDDTVTLQDVLKSPESDHDLRVAVARVWEELDPKLRAVWKLLVQEKANQVQVANHLRVHRNTVRMWIRRIQQLLKRHGF